MSVVRMQPILGWGLAGGSKVDEKEEGCYNTPASRRAFCRMVSFTAANTRRILLVSVACVKLPLTDAIRRHTEDKPSYRTVVSSERTGKGCILPLFPDPDPLTNQQRFFVRNDRTKYLRNRDNIVPAEQ